MSQQQHRHGLQILSDESLDVAIDTLEASSARLKNALWMIPTETTARAETMSDPHDAIEQMDAQLAALEAEAERRGL